MFIRAKSGMIVQVEGPASVTLAAGTITLHMGANSYTLASNLNPADAASAMSDLWDAWGNEGSFDFTQ